jgi:hypothetical protein
MYMSDPPRIESVTVPGREELCVLTVMTLLYGFSDLSLSAGALREQLPMSTPLQIPEWTRKRMRRYLDWREASPNHGKILGR